MKIVIHTTDCSEFVLTENISVLFFEKRISAIKLDEETYYAEDAKGLEIMSVDIHKYKGKPINRKVLEIWFNDIFKMFLEPSSLKQLLNKIIRGNLL